MLEHFPSIFIAGTPHFIFKHSTQTQLLCPLLILETTWSLKTKTTFILSAVRSVKVGKERQAVSDFMHTCLSVIVSCVHSETCRPPWAIQMLSVFDISIKWLTLHAKFQCIDDLIKQNCVISWREGRNGYTLLWPCFPYTQFKHWKKRLIDI